MREEGQPERSPAGARQPQTSSFETMSQMLRSSGAMGLATLGSRLLGLVRELVYAAFMGDGAVAGAFKLAFQVPNLFRRLLGEGVLTAAFIPIFKRKEKEEGDPAMWTTANAVLNGLVLFTLALVGLAMLGITLVLAAATLPALRDGQAVFPAFPIPILHADTELMLRLLRLMFPYLLAVCLAALSMGMLNARGHFFIPSLGAAMLNLVMISTVLFWAPRWGAALEDQVMALGWGVLLAGGVQFGFQLPTLWREGYRYRWINPWRHPVVTEVVRKMLPAVVGVAAFQINVLVIQAASFWVDRTIVASFDYAVRLMEFPQGIVGVSLATYLLPTLSGLAAEKRYPAFRATLREGLGYLVFVNLLATVFLLTLAEPMVRLLFERGAFSAASTQRAATALACLAPGLVAFSTVNVLARAFYALGDTKTPMVISVFCLGVNLLLSLALVSGLKQGGLGIANSLSSALNAGLLLHALRRKLSRLELESLRPTLWALAGAAVVTAVVAYGLRWGWELHLGHGSLLLRLGQVFVPMGVAAAVYWSLAWWLKVPAAHEVLSVLARRLRSRP